MIKRAGNYNRGFYRQVARNGNFSTQGKVRFNNVTTILYLADLNKYIYFRIQVYPSSGEAVKDIGDNSTILFGGFGVCGTNYHNMFSIAQ